MCIVNINHCGNHKENGEKARLPNIIIFLTFYNNYDDNKQGIFNEQTHATIVHNVLRTQSF